MALLQSKLLILIWATIWGAIVIFLLIYWKDLPTYLAIGLTIVEIIFVPDTKLIFKAIREKRGAE